MWGILSMGEEWGCLFSLGSFEAIPFLPTQIKAACITDFSFMS